MAAAKRRPRDPHPEEEQRGLDAALGADVLPPAVVLRGEERYFREAGVGRVLRAATGRGFELCRHDAADPELDLPRLMDDLVGGALFAKARCIVIRNAGALLNPRAHKYSKALGETIVRRLASGGAGVVVIAADKLRADHAVVKAAKKAGGVLVNCRPMWDTPPAWDPDPRRAELVQWLLGQARERGLALGPEEAVYLVGAKGNDPSALLAQLENLRGRGAAAVAQLVGWDGGASPWTIAEHLVVGDAARAVAGIESLFAGGFRGREGVRTVDRGGLVAMLAGAVKGKLRETVAGADVLEGGGDIARAAAAAGVRAPSHRKSFEARVGARRAGEWRDLLEQAAALERRSRSGAVVDANDFALLALRWRRA